MGISNTALLAHPTPPKHLGAEIPAAPKCPQNLGRGPKPNATVPRRRGDGRTRGAHYKYKIIICYKQKNIYCTSLTHIHKNTIYTERLGGARALQGGFLGGAAPPPRAGGCTSSTSVPKSPVKLTRTVRTARGWSERGPMAVPLPGEREAKSLGGERAGEGLSHEPTKCLGSQAPQNKYGPRATLLPPLGGGFCSQVGL